MGAILCPSYVALISILMTYTACNLETEPKHPPQSSKQKPDITTHRVSSNVPDAEALFRGLILGHGPVAQMVPEIREHTGLDATFLTQPQRTRALKVFDEIVDAVQRHRPGFLSWFEAEIASADPFRIDAALHQGAGIAAEMLAHTSAGPIPDDVTTSPDDPGVTAAVVWVVHVAVAVHVWAAAHNMVAVTTVGYGYFFRYVEVGEQVNSQSDMVAEMVVASVIRNVSPALDRPE